jgi:dTDP-4-amino-4,6-dideoxygalactose transaminase
MASLALRGGDPLRTKPWPEWPQYDERESRNLERALHGRNWGGFPSPNDLGGEFEEKFASFVGARFAITTTSGTTALEIGLRASGLTRGDEVLVPALTFYATPFAALSQGFVPVFVDIDPGTWCMDVEQVEAAITPRTRAIMPVHLGSRICDMEGLLEIARKHELTIIEDCAHAHGSMWNGKPAGTFGQIGCFSFQTSKLMTCGEGGLIVTDDPYLEDRSRGYMNSGRVRTSDRTAAEGTMLGWNYRMTEFQAAVLLAQLERLPEQIATRDRNVAHFERRIAEIDGVSTLARDPRQGTPSGYGVVLRYDAAAWDGVPRDRFAWALHKEGIRLYAAFYEPVYRNALFAWRDAPIDVDYSATRCPVAEKAAYEEMIWLPHEVFLGDESDIDDLCDAILKIREHIDELPSSKQ